MDLSTIGVFAFLDGLSGRQTGELARKLERLGYSALWIPEGWDAIHSRTQATC